MYKKLKIVSFEDYKNYETEYQNRLNSPSTIVTNLEIVPFSARTETRVTSEKYPLFVMVLPQHMELLETIHLNSLKIMELSRELPRIAHNKLVISKMIDEIQSTNDIEGIHSTKKELADVLQKKKKGVRFFGIVNSYDKIINGNDYTIIDDIVQFREIYDSLLIDDIDEELRPDGLLFRKTSVDVTKGDKKVHTGDPNENIIQSNLSKLVSFMNKADISFIIKAVVAHYFFEYIHPFYDGNGRMGRFLLSAYVSRKIDVFTGLSISQGVMKNSTVYGKAFMESSDPKNKGDLTSFTLDLMKIIIDGQEMMIDELMMLKSQLATAEQYVANKKLSELETNILFILMQHSMFNVNKEYIQDLAFSSGEFSFKVSKGKVGQAMDQLEKAGLVKVVQGRPKAHDITDKVKEVLE